LLWKQVLPGEASVPIAHAGGEGVNQPRQGDGPPEGVSASTPLYANFPRRLSALEVDAVLLIASSVFIFALASLVQGVEAARVGLVIAWWLLLLFYEPLLVWRLGGTVGHRALNLRVVDNGTESNVSLLKALARHGLKLVLGTLSFFTMNFSRRHQALHDIVTNSSVRIRDPAKARPEHYTLGRSTTEAAPRPSPWLRIWVHPRATVRSLLGTSRLPRELLLACGSGVVQSMVQAMGNGVGARLSRPVILLTTLVLGSVWGLLQLHLLAGVLYAVGRWTGQPAAFRHLRTALSWAAVPQVAILPLWLIGTLVIGRRLYVDYGDTPPMILPALAQGLLGVATLVCGIWWLVLQVFTVAEVQRVSAWRALANFVVGLVSLGVTVVVAVLVVAVVRRR
jgi:hypothetical protein